MLKKRATIIAIVISIIFYSVFVFMYEKYAHNKIQMQIEEHAMILADDLWRFNYRGASEYLKLAATSQSYESLVVTDHSGQVFASIDNTPHISKIEHFLVKINLMTRVTLMAHVMHEGNIIGWVEAIWNSDTFFLDAYLFLVLIMIVAIVHLYFHIVDEKRTLEERVSERTNKLVEINKSLEREVKERTRVESALRESEEKHRLLAENIHDVIWVMDMDLRLIYVSPAAEKMHGWRKEDWPEEINLKDILTPESYEKASRALAEHLHEGEKKGRYDQSTIVELEMFKKGGETLWAEVTASFLTDEDGNPDGVLGVSRDITNRLKSQDEKEALERKLIRSKKMESLGLLAGGVAHDLNNVLSGIVSYPDLILMDLPERSPMRSSILTIQRSGQKAAAIVQDLLTLARRGVVNNEPVNFNDLLSEHLKSPEHKKLLSYHPAIIIEKILEPRLPNITGSPIHLKKTIMNLLSNAAEAQNQGGIIKISTESRYLDKPVKGYDVVTEGDYVVLIVEDRGEGIDKSDLSRIFEPFYTKKVMGRSGTGLGMAVVWGTVQDHNGYIDIKSQVGKGTIFELYFPITHDNIMKAIEKISMNDLKGNRETILVVDDMEDQRDVALKILSALNYSVHTVASGEDALDFLKDEKVDLVVLDMIMDPGIDGLETYRRIIRMYPNQKAILASGFAETERVREAMILGAGEYVKKPYMVEKIGTAVKNELGRT